MKLIFFTDTHLGAVRSSHSTVASRVLLAETLFAQAKKAAAWKGEHDKLICLGDLFDTYSNDEKVIHQGIEIVDKCDLVLAGNHDVVSRSDKVGSLELLSRLGYEQVAINAYGEASTFSAFFDDTELVALPHVADQQMFVQYLKAAASEPRTTKHRMLLLHCNVDNEMVTGTNAALNLDQPLAKELLKSFDYILVGHEHDPRTLLGGKLIVLGNTQPLTFGEISDRYVWEFNTVTGEFTKHLQWSKMNSYHELSAEELLVKEGAIHLDRDFIDVQGKVEPGQLPALARAFVTLWKTNPKTLMVRNGVEVQHVEAKQVVSFGKIDLATIIRQNLEGTDLAELFDELAKEQ